MSLLKVDTVQGRSGTTISIADGHKLSGMGAGITEYDQWQLVNSTSPNTDGDLSGTWSRFDHSGATYIGTGMSVSSGVFTFPSTGKWEVIFTSIIANTGTDDQLNVDTMFTTDNSNYSNVAIVGGGQGSTGRNTSTSFILLDITDTSQCKVKFTVSSASANTYVFGSSNPSDTTTGKAQTYAIFKRIGDT